MTQTVSQSWTDNLPTSAGEAAAQAGIFAKKNKDQRGSQPQQPVNTTPGPTLAKR